MTTNTRTRSEDNSKRKRENIIDFSVATKEADIKGHCSNEDEKNLNLFVIIKKENANDNEKELITELLDKVNIVSQTDEENNHETIDCFSYIMSKFR